MSRQAAALARLSNIRHAIRHARDSRELCTRLVAVGETQRTAEGVMRRAGLSMATEMGASLRPLDTGPASNPHVEVVDDVEDNGPPTQPSRDDIPVVWEEPVRNVGWSVQEPTERILFVPDAHFPYVDRVAWGVMLACARRFKPHRIVVLGDFVDALTVSDHSKDPRRGTQLQAEMEAANEGLDELDALGAEHKAFVEGNHETRLYRYLCDRAPALLDTVQVDRLLRLPERGWTFHRYGTSFAVGDTYVTHAVNGQAGQNAHHRAAVTHMRSVVIGHTHRIATKVFGSASGERYQATMVGWLGSELDATYSHNAEKSANWAHGFGLGWKLPSGRVVVQAVPIVDRCAVLNGEVVWLAG